MKTLTSVEPQPFPHLRQLLLVLKSCVQSDLEDLVILGRFFLFFVLLLLAGCSAVTSRVDTQPTVNATPSSQDELYKIIDHEETTNGIPKGLLHSMAAVESQNAPYAVNAHRRSHRFRSKKAAAEFVNASVRRGCQNISVGCLQLHYKTHRRHFASIEDMLTPERNVSYAAALLCALYRKYGSWEQAVKMYHSRRGKLNKAYYAKVMQKQRFFVKQS